MSKAIFNFCICSKYLNSVSLKEGIVHVMSLEAIALLVSGLIVTVNVMTTEGFGGDVVYRYIS